jgi:hypothetical protein
VKEKIAIVTYCAIVLSAAGVLVAYIYWKPLLWYHWLLAALALPAFVLVLGAIAAAYWAVTAPKSKIVLSSPVPVLDISRRTTATDIRHALGEPTNQWDDETENCLEYSSDTLTIRFMCRSTQASSGRFQYLEVINEKPGNA